MSRIGNWINENVVAPIIVELTKPENLDKLIESVTAGVVEGVTGAVIGQSDRVITEITNHTAEDIDKIIGEVGTSISTVGQNITGDLDTLGRNLTTEINSVVTNLFTNIKNLFPRIPGFG